MSTLPAYTQQTRRRQPERQRVCWWVALLLTGFLFLSNHHAQAQMTVTKGTVRSNDALPTVVATIELNGFITDLLLDQANNRLYVTDQSGVLSVLDATSYRVVATLPVAGNLTLDPSYPRLYVTPTARTFGKPSTIQVIDTTMITVTATITNATDLSLDPEHGRIFIGNALQQPMPPNAPIGGMRVLDAETLATVTAAPIDGIPVYNPLRNELLIVAASLFRADPVTLAIQEDLFPEITAQPCKDCIGVEEVESAQVLVEEKLVALRMFTHSTPTGGRMLDPFRFLNATTLAPIKPPAAVPVTQATCNRRMTVQPRLDNRIYRLQSYASTFPFYHWRIESPTGALLAERYGLDAPYLNPNTNQAYASGWVLALPTLRPVGRLPALTCMLDQDQERGLLYAKGNNQLIILAESGGERSAPLPATPLPALPPDDITQIALSPNFVQDRTLFVTQGKALYRSTDGGDHWLPMTTLPLQNMAGLQVALSPAFAQDQTLFAAGNEVAYMGDGGQPPSGVFRSTDGGDHWQPVWQGLQPLRIYNVAVSPTFAADQTVLAYANYMQFDPLHDGKVIHRSTDGGLTWSPWITMTDGSPLPSATALLPGPTPPPLLPIRRESNDVFLERPRAGDENGLWERIDLHETLGYLARAILPAPDFAESGVVYLLGEHDLVRVRANGAIIEPWSDPRLTGRQVYSDALHSLAVSGLDSNGSYQLVLGTEKGELWVLDPATMKWQPPLAKIVTPPPPSQPAGTAPPLLLYTVQEAGKSAFVLRQMDGSQPRRVTLPPGLDDKSVHSFSPDGKWLAYYTGAVSRPDQPAADDLTLHLLNNESGEAITVAALLPPNFPENLAVNARLIGQRIPAVADDPQLDEGIWWGFVSALTLHAWSPDGRQLAFAGAMAGPSSDLYLYKVDDRSLTRLTDGPEQINDLRWSPDGQWIWHNSVSIGFCQSCYGHKYAVAAADGRIITIPGDEIDRFMGWLGPDRYLESDQANGIGDFHLSEVNLTAQTQRTLWAGSYQRFVLSQDRQRLFVVGSPTPSFDPEQVGLYEIALTSGEILTTSLDALPNEVTPWFSPPLRPCPYGTTLLAYPCDATIVSPFSPDGRWRVDQDLTLRTVDGRLVLPNATSQSATAIIWRRDSAGFYFLVDHDLYYRPLWESWPVLLEEKVSGMTWLETQ